MRLKNLVWKRTRYNVINNSTNPIDTQIWEALTPLRHYKVYRAVGGGYFYQWSGMTNNYGGFPGFNSDADSIMGKPKIRRDSIEDGKAICEKNWQVIGKVALSMMAE